MDWVKFFLHGEIPGAFTLGRCSWLRCPPKHTESNSAALTVMCAGEQSWQRTWWQDMLYPHTATCQGRSLGNAWGWHAAEKPQDQPHQGCLLPPLALPRGNHMLKVTLIQRKR